VEKFRWIELERIERREEAMGRTNHRLEILRWCPRGPV